jgi:hypothetical protein
MEKNQRTYLAIISVLIITIIGGIILFHHKKKPVVQSPPENSASVDHSLDITKSWKTYSSHSYGFSIQYPFMWTVDANAYTGLLTISDSYQSLDVITIKASTDCKNSSWMETSDHIFLKTTCLPGGVYDAHLKAYSFAAKVTEDEIIDSLVLSK